MPAIQLEFHGSPDSEASNGGAVESQGLHKMTVIADINYQVETSLVNCRKQFVTRKKLLTSLS